MCRFTSFYLVVFTVYILKYEKSNKIAHQDFIKNIMKNYLYYFKKKSHREKNGIREG